MSSGEKRVSQINLADWQNRAVIVDDFYPDGRIIYLTKGKRVEKFQKR